jgi:dTDP-4-dehydrorhamnose reductase
MINIWVIGAGNSIGLEISELANIYTEFNFRLSGFLEIDLADKDRIESILVTKDIKVVINCLENPKYVFPNLNLSLVEGMIIQGIEVLADVCKAQEIKLIQVSTDEVFDGQKKGSYPENMTKRPLSLYGNLMDGVEKKLNEIAPDNALIIRSSWLFSLYGNNFLKSLLDDLRNKDRIHLENDQISCPTHAKELTYFILEYCIIDRHQGVEIYHFRNRGHCSKYEFSLETEKYLKSNCTIIPVFSDMYLTAEEMDYSRILNTNKISEKFNHKTAHWKDAVKRCMDLMVKC